MTGIAEWLACIGLEEYGQRPFRRELGISDGVLDVLMPEVVLRAGVLAVIGQFETAGMAEHMRVHVNCIFAAFPSLVIILRKPAASWALRARSRTRSAQALARAGGAVGAEFGAGQGVDPRYAILGAGDVQPSMGEIDGSVDRGPADPVAGGCHRR
jgi:hypothetical protein